MGQVYSWLAWDMQSLYGVHLCVMHKQIMRAKEKLSNMLKKLLQIQIFVLL